jgi:predicted nucleic acid-binding protein
MSGLTFDTGALIGLERKRHGIRKVFATAVKHGVPIFVPTAVIVEWWRRGLREKERSTLLRAVQIEPLGPHLAKLAGSAVGLVPGATPVDAIVMASAAQRDDVVYTSDPDDLEALRASVPEFSHVRIALV